MVLLQFLTTSNIAVFSWCWVWPLPAWVKPEVSFGQPSTGSGVTRTVLPGDASLARGVDLGVLVKLGAKGPV